MPEYIERSLMKIYLTYEDIQQQIIKDANIIRKEFNPTHIIAIANGGLIPAVYMAKALGVYNMQIIGVKSYEHQEQGNMELYHDISYNALENERVLIVDDIYDTGKTFEYVSKLIVDNGNAQRIRSYAVCKKGTHGIGADYYGVITTAMSTAWVVFPWETNGKS
jgi:xanthine phosphoribosyltransferase